MIDCSYDRNVDHCSPTTYLKLVTVVSIEPAINSDNLEIIKFKEIGWQVISQKGLHYVGKKLTYIAPESILPNEFAIAIGVHPYLSKSKVRVAKLRGNRSEGIVIDPELIKPWIPHIYHWEDLPSIGMGGDAVASQDIPMHFHKFYKMPNIMNEPETFYKEEEVFESEKIHGTNVRFGKFYHPLTGEITKYVGSHNVVLKEGDNVYWNTVNRSIDWDNLPVNNLFFGEIYGMGIQDLRYDLKIQELKVFAISFNMVYLNLSEIVEICADCNVPMVHKNLISFDLELVRKIAESPSTFTNAHIREGIVLVSKSHPDRMAKCLSFKYLDRKGGTERK